MSKLELTYSTPTACEGVRILLRLGNHNFDEKRVAKEELDAEKAIGCKLVVDAGEKSFKMGGAILRLLGKITTLDGAPLYPVGKTDKDNLFGLEIDDNIDKQRELKSKLIPLLRDTGDRRPQSLARAQEEVMPPYFEAFEDMIKAQGYLAGSSMSVADLEFFSILVFIMREADSAKMMDSYPSMKNYYTKVESHAQLKEAREKANKSQK